MNQQALRVLHVIDCLAPGGAERMLVELVNGLQSNMVEPSVCVTRQDTTLARNIHKGISLHRLDRKYTWDIQAAIRFRKIVRDENLQILHTHGYSTFLFVVFACFGLDRQVPIILHAHNSTPPRHLVCLFGKLLASHFIGVSPVQLVWARKRMFLTENKISMLGNAIDFRPYQMACSLDVSSYFKEPPNHVGIVTANVLPVKNFEFLFRALSLSKYKSRIGLLVAGSTAQVGYFEQCKKWLLELGLQDNVIFLGSREDIPDLLASVDFGVLSSERETGPVAILEYMAARLPFVATNVGQIAREASMAGLSGIVPPNEPMAFAAALDELLQLSQEAREKRIQMGLQLLQSRFDIRERIITLEEIYQQLLRPANK